MCELTKRHLATISLEYKYLINKENEAKKTNEFLSQSKCLSSTEKKLLLVHIVRIVTLLSIDFYHQIVLQ